MENGEGEADGHQLPHRDRTGDRGKERCNCAPNSSFKKQPWMTLAANGGLRLRTTDVTANLSMEIDAPADMAAALTYFDNQPTVAARRHCRSNPTSPTVSPNSCDKLGRSFPTFLQPPIHSAQAEQQP